METLPDEILTDEIFSRIVEYATVLRAVCRGWRRLLAPLPLAGREEMLTVFAERHHLDLLNWVWESRGRMFAYTERLLILEAAKGYEPVCDLVLEWQRKLTRTHNRRVARVNRHVRRMAAAECREQENNWQSKQGWRAGKQSAAQQRWQLRRH